MKTWVTQLRKGLLEFYVLNVLAIEESYGYRIVERLRRVEGLQITESTVYPILARLTKDGFLQERLSPSSAGPPRRYLSLTPEGRERVEQMNDYWRALLPSIESLLQSGQDNA